MKKKILLLFVTTKITKSDIFSRNIYKLIRNICTYNYLQTVNMYLKVTYSPEIYTNQLEIYVHTVIYKLLTCIWIVQLCHYFLNISSHLPSRHKLSSIKLIFVIHKIIQKEVIYSKQINLNPSSNYFFKIWLGKVTINSEKTHYNYNPFLESLFFLAMNIL